MLVLWKSCNGVKLGINMIGVDPFIPESFCDYWLPVAGRCKLSAGDCLNQVGKNQCGCYCLKIMTTGEYFNAFPVEHQEL
jgi:hypothetical protein